MDDELHELLTLPEAAALAGVSHSTIYKRVAEGRFPKPFRLGRTVRWSEAEVREWLGRDADMLSTRDVMDYLQVSRMTVRAMVSDGRLPRPERVGNADFWHSEGLEALASISRPAGSSPRVVDVDAGVAADRLGRLVQYGTTALSPGDVETPPTLRDVSWGPVAQLRYLLAEAVGLAGYLPDDADEDFDINRSYQRLAGRVRAAEPLESEPPADAVGLEAGLAQVREFIAAAAGEERVTITIRSAGGQERQVNVRIISPRARRKESGE